MGFKESKSFAESPKYSNDGEKNTFSPDRQKKSSMKVRIMDETDIDYSWKRGGDKAKEEDFERDSQEDQIAHIVQIKN